MSLPYARPFAHHQQFDDNADDLDEHKVIKKVFTQSYCFGAICVEML
jgi:hypothetical protein